MPAAGLAVDSHADGEAERVERTLYEEELQLTLALQRSLSASTDAGSAGEGEAAEADDDSVVQQRIADKVARARRSRGVERTSSPALQAPLAPSEAFHAPVGSADQGALVGSEHTPACRI